MTVGLSILSSAETGVTVGWQEMAEIDAGQGRASLHAGLAAACPDMEKNALAALAAILSAGFDHAALAIASGEPPDRYVDALMLILDRLATQG